MVTYWLSIWILLGLYIGVEILRKTKTTTRAYMYTINNMLCLNVRIKNIKGIVGTCQEPPLNIWHLPPYNTIGAVTKNYCKIVCLVGQWMRCQVTSFLRGCTFIYKIKIKMNYIVSRYRYIPLFRFKYQISIFKKNIRFEKNSIIFMFRLLHRKRDVLWRPR